MPYIHRKNNIFRFIRGICVIHAAILKLDTVNIVRIFPMSLSANVRVAVAISRAYPCRLDT